jgi:sugar phosphate isomerase/epimerase
VNTPSITRRDFVRAGLLAGVGATAIGSGRTASAATPPARNGRSHLKLSLAAYSFNRVLPKNWSPSDDGQPAMTLDDFVRLCADLDLDGTELTSYYFPREVTPAYLMHLKELTFRLGLDISGTAIGNNFCVPPGPKRDEQLQLTRTWIDHAATMGAPVIRIFAGTVAKGQSEPEALDLCVAGINQSLEYAAEKGVFLALENHGGITSTAEQLLAIVKRVDSPWFGVNLDSGNFQTPDPYGDLAKIAPYAVNAQLKTEIAPNGKKQEADLARIVGILRDAGYRGYIVLEYEAAEDPKIAVPRHIETLRKIIRA